MNTMNKKQLYIAPQIERIELDNEISLVLQSEAPPTGPGESTSYAPDYFNPDPFKTNVG
jgi:hypothetical protein